MKKWLAMALTLALILGLAAPALAAEADPLPDWDEWDGYESEWEKEQALRDEYAASHPDEIAGLDVEKLLAGWGYEDVHMTAEEAFMDACALTDESLEEAVIREYIDDRLLVRDVSADAEEYKAQYPEEWATFDPDAFFETGFSYRTSYENKENYCAYWCILTDEEFADDMFVYYANDLAWGEPDWWVDQDQEPTLTLYVNGVATDVELVAENGVSYADADALRQLVGPEAVPADQTGLIPVRATAEAAGWDVGWYDGGWWGWDQEVQLWDKPSYETYLAEEFGPLNDFLAKAMEQSMALLFSEEGTAGHQEATVNLTRFSTLDGNKDYKLTLAVDYTAQNGVMDMTFTFDAAQLLQLVSVNDLTAMAGAGGFSVTQLTSLLRAGKAELIIDYNEGVIAYNVPLLALIDEELAGWQGMEVPGLDMALEELTGADGMELVSTLYAQMVTSAQYRGAESAFDEYDGMVTLLSLFAGKDRFITKNGKTTYSFNTKDMNAALTTMFDKTVMGLGAERLPQRPEFSFFKACDLTCTMDDNGSVTMDLHIRPDMEGIAAATGATSYDSLGLATVLSWFLPAFDMDFTATASGNQSRSTQRVDIHWNNVGKLSMTTTATTRPATKAPRTVEEVSPQFQPSWYESDVAIIGGIDGPTAILTTG